MEFVSGQIKIRDIFLDKGNWWRLWLAHPKLIRSSIVINVLKMLACRTSFLGYHVFVCPQCLQRVQAPHTCKSRFCSSCGKKATDNWVGTAINTLPDTIWQHMTWTIPSVLQPFLWHNRYLFNRLPLLAANIVKQWAAKKHFLPGLYLALHTFGRDLKRNGHIHLSTTAGGLSEDRTTWVSHVYFPHEPLKRMWRYAVINLFRSEFQAGRLRLPKELRHLKTYTAFNSWLNVLYHKTWVVHLNEQSNNRKATIEYLGKYLKRPPLGETRIKAYDGITVTFEYLDHYTNTTATMTLPVLEFIGRLLAHIPDRYFRNIRYYGFLATRVRGQLLPHVRQLLGQVTNLPHSAQKVYTSWRQMLVSSFGKDPLRCPACGALMALSFIVFPAQRSLTAFHQEIAHGYFKLL